MKSRIVRSSFRAAHSLRRAVAFPAKWAWHRRTLRALRRHLLHDQLEQMRERLQPAPPVAEGSPAGSGEEHDFALALLAREPDALREINDALDRIEQGRYGVCPVTGLSIPAARLRAAPWTRQLHEVGWNREIGGPGG